MPVYKRDARGEYVEQPGEAALTPTEEQRALMDRLTRERSGASGEMGVVGAHIFVPEEKTMADKKKGPRLTSVTGKSQAELDAERAGLSNVRTATADAVRIGSESGGGGIVSLGAATPDSSAVAGVPGGSQIVLHIHFHGEVDQEKAVQQALQTIGVGGSPLPAPVGSENVQLVTEQSDMPETKEEEGMVPPSVLGGGGGFTLATAADMTGRVGEGTSDPLFPPPSERDSTADASPPPPPSGVLGGGGGRSSEEEGEGGDTDEAPPSGVLGGGGGRSGEDDEEPDTQDEQREEGPPYFCQFCDDGREFGSMAGLTSHVRATHPDEYEDWQESK